jgi:hypothetical protein
VNLHQRLGIGVVLVAVAGTVLVLMAARRRELMPTVRVFLRLCAATAAVEALVGLLLLVSGHRPGQAIHYFYAVATVIPMPAADVLARRVHARNEVLYLLAGAVATVLFGLRAVTTGSP